MLCLNTLDPFGPACRHLPVGRRGQAERFDLCKRGLASPLHSIYAAVMKQPSFLLAHPTCPPKLEERRGKLVSKGGWLSTALTTIGRRFGIDAHYFAKNSTLVLLGHLVSILRGLITGYLVARLFEKEIYGQYQFILSIVGTLSLFGLPGLAHSVTRAWARGDAFSLRKITIQQLRVCLIGSAILLGCIPFLNNYGRGNLWPLFLAAAVLFPLPPIAMVHFGGFTVGKARFDISLRASVVWSSLTILATLLVIFLRQSALLMLLISMSIPSLVYLSYSRRLQPPQESGTRNTNAIIRYGWQLTFSTLPVDLVWYVDKLLISHFFGLSQLATFSVALLIPEQAKLFFRQFFPVTFSRQAKGEDSLGRRRRLMKIVLFSTAFFAFGIGLYITLSPWLMPLLFPQYPAVELVLLTSVAAATLITIPGGLFAQYLEAQGRISEVRLSNWSAAILFALSLFLLIPRYGLLGAVLSRSVFRFTHWGVNFWFAMRAPLPSSSHA